MSGYIIKCNIPSGGRDYIGDGYGKGKDWTLDDLTFTPDAKEAHVFTTLDAALRVKDKLHKDIEPEIIDLNMPAKKDKHER